MEKLLNRLLADLVVEYHKLQSYHWYLKGYHFFDDHPKLESYYDMVAGMVDGVAEDMLKLSLKPESTLKGFLAITAIQESAAKSMDSVDNVALQIEQANDFAQQSGQALTDIVVMVESTSDQVTAISSASEGQSAASDQVTSVIDQINGMSRQTASAMHAATEAVEDLAAQANGLSGLIAQMRAQ